MKRLLLALLVTATLGSCNHKNITSHSTEFQINGSSVEILTIDSCEYLFAEYGRAALLTHKGNCKFCKHRSSPIQ